MGQKQHYIKNNGIYLTIGKILCNYHRITKNTTQISIKLSWNLLSVNAN